MEDLINLETREIYHFPSTECTVTHSKVATSDNFIVDGWLVWFPNGSQKLCVSLEEASNLAQHYVPEAN